MHLLIIFFCSLAELKAEGKLTPSVLNEVTELKRLTGRMAKDVRQLLEEYRSFTGETIQIPMIGSENLVASRWSSTGGDSSGQLAR